MANMTPLQILFLVLKWALIILNIILIVQIAIQLIDMLSGKQSGAEKIVDLIILICIILVGLLGLFGAWKEDFQYVLAYAIILVVLLVVRVVLGERGVGPVANIVLVAIIAFGYAFMLKNGSGGGSMA